MLFISVPGKPRPSSCRRRCGSRSHHATAEIIGLVRHSLVAYGSSYCFLHPARFPDSPLRYSSPEFPTSSELIATSFATISLRTLRTRGAAPSTNCTPTSAPAMVLICRRSTGSPLVYLSFKDWCGSFPGNFEVIKTPAIRFSVVRFQLGSEPAAAAVISCETS
jgi:hypothetical protein